MKMKPDTPQIASAHPRRRWGRRLLRIGLGILVLLVIALGFLYSPSGQRWAVSKVVEQAAGALGEQEVPVRLGLEHVGLDWAPVGIVLEGLRLTTTGDSASVSYGSLERVRLRPADRSGVHWSTMELVGLELTAAGRDWLMRLSGAGADPTDAAPDFKVDRLDVLGGRLPLDASWIPDGRAHVLLVDTFSMSAFDSGAPGLLDTGKGTLRLVSTSNEGVGDTTRLHLTGGAGSVQGQLMLDPERWLNTMDVHEELVAAIPHEWAFEGHWLEQRTTVRGIAPWCALDVALHWTDDAFILERASLDHGTIPFQAPDWLPAAGRVDLEGPVHCPLRPSATDGAPRSFLSALSGHPTLAWTARGEAAEAGRIQCGWNLATGLITAEGAAYDMVQDQSVEVHWDLSGRFTPLSDLVDRGLSDGLALNGTCTAAVSGEQAGSGSTTGVVGIETRFDDAGGIETDLALKARSAPIIVTEGLELHGEWTMDAQAGLSAEGALESWWSNLSVHAATLIPLPGFDGRTTQGRPLSLNRLMLRGRGNAEHFELDLEGDFIRGRAEGPLDGPSWLGPLAAALESGGLEELVGSDGQTASVEGPSDAGPWQVDVTLWRNDLLERFSHDQWSFGPGSHVILTHGDGLVQFDLDLMDLHLGPIHAEALNLVGAGGNTPLMLEAEGQGLSYLDWVSLDGFYASAQAPVDSISIVRMDWDGAIHGGLEFKHTFGPEGNHALSPSLLNWAYGDAAWSLAAEEEPVILWNARSEKPLAIRDFKLIGDRGSVLIDTPDSALETGAALQLRLDHFPTGPWLDLLEAPLSMDLPVGSGLINGTVQFGFSPFVAFGDIEWIDAVLEGIQLGDLCLRVGWKGDGPQLDFQQFQGDRQILSATNAADPKVLEIALSDWPLNILQPKIGEYGVRALGSIRDTVWIPLQSEAGGAMRGNVLLDVAELEVDAIGMTYSMNGTLDVSPGYFGMDQAIMRDRDGHEAIVNLSFLHEEWRHWNYDIGLDLPETFNVMDVKPDPSALYHGQVMATGEANVFGTADFMEIEAHVRSAPGTRFTMPLDAVEGPDIPSGIRFVGGSSVEKATAEDRPFDVDLELEIEVTPEAQLRLVLDQQAGELVEGRASGALSIVRNQNQSLFMQGGLDIEEGFYRFSLRDLLTKIIDIAPGGRIDWDGNPYEANMSLLAIAPLKADPRPLLPGLRYDAKTSVDVGLGIFGALSNPKFDFSVSFPDLEQTDPTTLSQLNAALSTREETERQALALLAIGQFIPPEQLDVQLFGQTAAATQASDLVSAGVSELLNNLSEDVVIGVRYSPSSSDPGDIGAVDDADALGTQDAFEMDLGFNLLDDRLRISGTVGAQGGGNSANQEQGQDLRGGFDVRYQLTPDGRWELIGYLKPESDLDDHQFRQGIGAVYQVRFDRLSELFGRSRKKPVP